MPTITRSLNRFRAAQDRVYPKVIREINRGVKETHWMWYVFPQLQGLAKSEMAYRFGITDRDEADNYLTNDVLAQRLFECTTGVLRQRRLMFSDTDRRKLWACMTLFREVAPDPGPLDDVLGKFFEGRPDQRTLDLLAGKTIDLPGRYDPNARPTWLKPSRPAGLWDERADLARRNIAARQAARRDFDPWTRERVTSFVRSFGLSSVGTRQLVEAWMADRGRAMGAAWAARDDAQHDWDEEEAR